MTGIPGYSLFECKIDLGSYPGILNFFLFTTFELALKIPRFGYEEDSESHLEVQYSFFVQRLIEKGLEK